MAAQITVSHQLLAQTGADFDRILIADLGRKLSSVLDREALLGAGVDEPLGVANHPGTLKLSIAGPTLWPAITALETAIAVSDVSVDTYGHIMSHQSRERLPTTPVFSGGAFTIWDQIMRAIASNQLATDRRLFFGCFPTMVLGVFGGVDLVINPYTRAGSGLVQIVGNLFCDVGFRLPAALGVSLETLP